MKKFIMMTLAFALLLGATSCTSCNHEKQKKETTVEQAIKTDNAYMEAEYEDFVWYESQITLTEWLDSSNSAAFVYVDNVFQYIDDGQPNVIVFTHYYNGKCDTSRHDDFWIEDCAMTPAEVTLTFSQAYDRLMATNYPKPHSRNCTLRKPVGPYSCNPQYVFGTIYEPIFVDAVTGNVSATNPAFNKRE